LLLKDEGLLLTGILGNEGNISSMVGVSLGRADDGAL